MSLTLLGRPVRHVLLDRDGTINAKAPEGDYIRRPDDLKLLPGAADAVRRLNAADVSVFVVTNQRGVALGLMTLEDLAAVHARLFELLGEQDARIDDLEFCVHDRNSCDCRKPDIGMAIRLQRRHPDLDPASTVVIGDSDSDIEFGSRLGAGTIRIGTAGTAVGLFDALTRFDSWT